MADLGSITYTSVVWTAGDIITEAKLDNMVANDQAYDAHAAQGVLVNNEKAIAGKVAGGTAYNMLKMNSSDYMEIGASGISTLVKGIWSGWIDSPAAWTRTGNFTFTIAGDYTAIFRKGVKIRYKDGGAFEYGYVESSSYSNPNTTVTLVTNANYTMAAASITEPGYSLEENPAGFPEWFTFTTTFSGFSADPSTTSIYFKLNGLLCTFYYVDGTDGTSNGTGLTFTLPVAAARNWNHAGWIGIKDNGTISSTPGHLTMTASSKTVAAYKTFSQGAWTASGAKNIFVPHLSYEWT